jgi:hypothetical protein
MVDSLTRKYMRCKDNVIGINHGGVEAPVGLTVFKTAGRPLGAVSGGFDSHTPLPVLYTSKVVPSSIILDVYNPNNFSELSFT